MAIRQDRSQRLWRRIGVFYIDKQQIIELMIGVLGSCLVNGKKLKKMRINVMMVLTLILSIYSCNPKSSNKISENRFDDETQVKEELTEPEGRIYTFECDTLNRRVKFSESEVLHFPYDLRRCLLRKSFEGDIESEKQLAIIIREAGMEDFRIFGRDPKFRGPIVFEALLLDVPHNSEIYVDHDMVRSINSTKWDSYSRNINNSIDNIDGKSVNNYLDEELNKAKIRKGPRNDEEIALLSNAVRNILIEAWQTGKIVLKDYGEE